MPDLKLTPARLDLLRAIADGRVDEAWYNDEPGEVFDRPPGRMIRVTGKLLVMKAAGLCETDPRDADMHVRGIVLTAKGAQVLAQHAEEAS